MDHDEDEGGRPQTNPIHVINQTLSDVVGVVGNVPAGLPLDYGAPDVVKRGVLTPQEVRRPARLDR